MIIFKDKYLKFRSHQISNKKWAAKIDDCVIRIQCPLSVYAVYDFPLHISVADKAGGKIENPLK